MDLKIDSKVVFLQNCGTAVLRYQYFLGVSTIAGLDIFTARDQTGTRTTKWGPGLSIVSKLVSFFSNKLFWTTSIVFNRKYKVSAY